MKVAESSCRLTISSSIFLILSTVVDLQHPRALASCFGADQTDENAHDGECSSESESGCVGSRRSELEAVIE